MDTFSPPTRTQPVASPVLSRVSARSRLICATVVAVTACLFAASSASAVTYGPFGENRWEVRQFSDAGPVSLDLRKNQYCEPANAVSADSGEYFTGFSAPPPAPGMCRTVVATYPETGDVDLRNACKRDIADGRVVSDVTFPATDRSGAGVPISDLGVLPAGSWSRVCVFGQVEDGRWHAIAGAMLVAIGPFKLLDRPTIRLRATRAGQLGEANVLCRQRADRDAPVPNDRTMAVSLRANGRTVAKTGTNGSRVIFKSAAIRPGARLTARCDFTARVSQAGDDDFPRARSTRPFYTSTSKTVTVPRRR